MSVVIVGASLSGLRTAEALRMRGHQEGITLIGAEAELPYDRPPLSKEHLAPGPPPEPVLLRKEAAYAELDLDLRLGVRATGADLAARRVRTDDGEEVPFDHLVVATGGHARRARIADGLAGFHVVRTRADADALRADLDANPRVVVLGGGFIGAEVAASARARGLDVTMVEALPAPLSRALGDRVGDLLARAHRENGVDVRCGVTVEQARGGDRVEQVVLSDGTVLAADVVVMGLGVTPAVEWLAGSGLDLTDGVLCDARLRAVGHEAVFAVGDVARWPNATTGATARVEHWTSANEHADAVASTLTGTPREAASVPYVWSDQYGRRIQIVGRPRPDDAVTVVEDPEGRHLAAYERNGRLVAVMGVGSARAIARARRAVASGTVPAAEFLASL